MPSRNKKLKESKKLKENKKQLLQIKRKPKCNKKIFDTFTFDEN